MVTEQAHRVYAEYFIACFMILLHESKRWRTHVNLCEKYFEHLTFIGLCIIMYFYSKTNWMHQYLIFILFWNNTLRVLDSLKYVQCYSKIK
jgi:hypothetical protein